MKVEPISMQYVDHCGQCRTGWNEQMGGVLSGSDGFKLLVTFDDKDISTKLHRPDEQGGVQWKRIHQIPDQRAPGA